MVCGRLLQPRRLRPSAIAPLETSTQRLPAARSSATCAAQRAIAAASRPRPALVTSEEPTLTTSVCAPPMTSGRTARLLRFCGDEAPDPDAELAAAPAADRRDHEPFAPPAQLPDDGACGRLRILRVFLHVGLVEYQPARLSVQRRVVLLQLEGERACVA